MKPSAKPEFFRDRVSPLEGLALLWILGMFVFLFSDVLFGGMTFYFRDIVHNAFPMKHFIWRSFHEGALPLWWPDIFSGVPFLPILQPGVFHPLSLFFFLDNFITAFNLFLLSQFLVLCLSVYFLMRYWGVSPAAAAVAGTTALLGGYFLSLSALDNHFESAVWFPLVLLFFHKFLREGRWGSFAFTVVFFTFEVLGGSPEDCLFTAIVLLTFCLAGADAEDRIRRRAARCAAFALCILFTLGLSAVQLLPTWNLLDHLPRSRGLAYEKTVVWSLRPDLLATLILPRSYQSFMTTVGFRVDTFLQSHYMGLLPVIGLLAFTLLPVRHRQSPLWLGLFWAGLFFALGDYNPLYRLFFDWVPLFDTFRFPEKFFYLSAFAMVFLSGFGADALARALEARAIRLTGFLLVLLGLAVAVVGIEVVFRERGLLMIGALLVLLLTGGCGALLYLRKEGAQTFLFCLLALVSMDLWVANRPIVPFTPRNYYETPPALLGEVMLDEPKRFRVFSGPLEGNPLPTKTKFPPSVHWRGNLLALKERLYANFVSIYGVQAPDGALGVKLDGPELWLRLLDEGSKAERRRLLEQSNVRYWVTDELAIPPDAAHIVGLQRIETFDRALPRAFLVGEAHVLDSDSLRSALTSDSWDPLHTVLVDKDPALKGEETFRGEVQELLYGPNSAIVQTSQEGEGMLVLLDSWFPGWTARVDGRPAEIFRANGFFRAVRLGPGEHRVDFAYVPEGLHAGAEVSLLFLVLLLLSVFVPAPRRPAFSRTEPLPRENSF